MNYYVITIRKSVKTKTLKQAQTVVKNLTYFMNRIKKENTTSDVRYHWEDAEHNDTHNIHVHGIIKSPTKMNKPKVDKGYFVHFEPMRNETAWNKYITKSADTSERILFRMTPSNQRSGPDLLGRPAEPLEVREYHTIMKNLKVHNLFKLRTLNKSGRTIR
jgi:hypothetical protein